MRGLLTKIFCRLGIFNPARVYDLFGEILAALSLFSLVLCAFLVYKVDFLTQILLEDEAGLIMHAENPVC